MAESQSLKNEIVGKYADVVYTKDKRQRKQLVIEKTDACKEYGHLIINNAINVEQLILKGVFYNRSLYIGNIRFLKSIHFDCQCKYIRTIEFKSIMVVSKTNR